MCLVLLGLPSAWAGTPTPSGTTITMHSTLTWQSPSTAQAQALSASTSQAMVVTGVRTPSSVAFLAYAPGSSTIQPVGPTQCEPDGPHTHLPQKMPAPVSAQGTRLDPDKPLPLGPAQLYYPGDPVFVEVTDHDQNLNPDKRETVDVTVTVDSTSQKARVRLTETGVDSGAFTGYVFTTRQASPSDPCTLVVKPNQNLVLHYADAQDASDQSHADALISPYNIVFDASTGQAVNGARITLVNAQTGQPAAIIGRDGVSRFPSSVVSGQETSDSAGAKYQAAAGAYLLPEVKPGAYRLEVQTPAGYRYASSATTKNLQNLPDAPFTLAPASFGKTFTLTHTQAIGFDIPLDPVSTHLFVQKTASQTMASVGDMLQFNVTVENTDTQLAAGDVRLVDTLPQGFRYVPHSARVSSSVTTPGATRQTALEPTISADGQQLTFALGDLAQSGQVHITYVTAVSAATPLGTATNVAQGFASGGAQSNVANAQVQIRNQLMQNVNTLVGRVIIGCGSDEAHPPKGLAGVHILMEDGSYTVTDAHGRYHFPDVLNGTHVVQLDTDSLPAGYAVQACQQNTRFAGRNYSQFVEVHGGALWHADFHVRILPPPSGAVSLQVSQQRSDAGIDNTLDMAVDTVPLKHLSASVLLSAGSQYVEGSARLNGQPTTDPMVVPGALIFRLNDRAAGWHGKLQFKLTSDKSAKAPATTVLLNFNTPAASGQHAKPVKVTLEAAQTQSAMQRTPTKGLSPVAKAAKTAKTAKTTGDKVGADVKTAKDGKKAKRDQPQNIHLDAAWFASADSTPEFVLPKPGANPASPAIRVAVKHAPGQKVRLTINGQPVGSRSMMGAQVNARKTAAVSGWLGVPLTEGNNLLVAEILKGKTVVKRIQRKVHYSGDPVRAEIVPAQSHLVADGKTRPRLAIRLFDRWGYPVRKDLTGHFTLNAPYQSWRSIEQLQQNPLGVTAASRQPSYTVGDDGIAMVELAPTTASGQITIEVPLANNTQQELHAWMKPGKRDWILVGLATGTAAFNHITGHMRTLSGDDPNKDLFQDGRVAFYAKGMVKGKYLLTLAYDTAKKKGLAPSGLASLSQQIDPNQYFMLYGDASHVGHDAQSNSKLYLKIERGQFNVVFGEFDTGLNVTELARYDRRFNGLKSQYRGKHFGYTAFAARNAQSFVKDEMQGNGTSGLYHLSHRQILLNSERITLVTRDRYHSQEVVSTKPLTRFVDYTLDYTTGAIFFKLPVPSVDENLNPVYIVADYEVTRPGDQAITAGGRAAWRSSDNRVEVGATAVDEGSQLGDNHLTGVDVRVELGKATELKAEMAHTRTGASGSRSQLTGFNPYGGVSTGNNSHSSGLAWQVNIKHQGKQLQGEIYARQLGPDFGLGQQSFGESGMRKVGGDGIYRINEYWQLQGEAWNAQSLANGTTRNAVNIGARWKGKSSTFNFGLRHTDDHYLQPATYGNASTQGAQANPTTPAATPVQTGNGSTNQVQLGGSTGFFDNKLTLHATTRQDIAGGSDAAMPSMTTVGVDYAVTKSASLFLQQQYASGGKVAASRMTQFGVRATPWQKAQLQSAIGQQMTEYGPRLFATTGLTQGWSVGKHLTLNAGFNQSKSLRKPNVPTNTTGVGNGGAVSVDSNATQPVPGSINPATPSVAGSSTEDFTSGFLGAAWNQKDWSATSRVEMLHSTSEQRVGLMGGVYHQLSAGNGLAASLQAFKSDFHDGGKSSQVNLRLSFAHRPDGGYWSFLEQLDLSYGNQQGMSGSPFLAQGATGIATSQTTGQTPAQLAANQGTASTWGINQRSRKVVNNLQANFHTEYFEWSLYLGVKYATYHFDSGNYAGLTTLISSESRYDISPTWDFGLIMSRLTTWKSDVSKNGMGVELGHAFGKNMWVSLGYNFTGFEDRDFSAARYTAQGAFVRFRVKFDQDTIKHMLQGNLP